MAVFSKPQFNSIWANTGTKTPPQSEKISQGWVVEIPPYEYDNWIRNRQDAMLAHINQAGVVAWDASVEYQAGKSYVQSPSGVVFKALTTHTGVNPDIDVNGNWEVAFQRSGEALLKAQNLADVPDKAQARTNLGIATTADYDSRFLRQVQNLADLPSKPTARGNLDVYSKQEVIDLINNMQPAGEVAPFATSLVPSGWLECNGATVSRTTYSRLFNAIGTRFGAGNGSTTFQLPDLRGEFIRGWDAGRGLDTGRVLGSVQGDQNRLHSHSINDPGHSHTTQLARELMARGSNAVYGDESMQGFDNPVTNHVSTGIRINADGGNESRPRNVALLYCIRT